MGAGGGDQEPGVGKGGDRRAFRLVPGPALPAHNSHHRDRMTPTSTATGRLVERDEDIRALLERTHRIAVLGIKVAETMQPAYYVPEYAQRAGYEIVPVPVYYPEVKEILGAPVFRKLVEIPGAIDMVNVFRRPKDLAMHLEDILAKRPKSVWLQLGIRDDSFAAKLADAGIDVVQDRCLLVELRRVGR